MGGPKMKAELEATKLPQVLEAAAKSSMMTVQAGFDFNNDPEPMHARKQSLVVADDAQNQAAQRYRPSAASAATVQPQPRKIQANFKHCDGQVQYSLLLPDAARSWLPIDQEGNPHAWGKSSVHVRWIVTCSYNRYAPGKTQALLNREKAMEPLNVWEDYAQVLIVRESELQGYHNYCGHHYIIVGMPEQLTVEYKCADDCSFYDVTSEHGGIGYARLFAQLLVHSWGLNEVWMLDDNIKYTYFIEVRAVGELLVLILITFTLSVPCLARWPRTRQVNTVAGHLKRRSAASSHR
jgi:hypothetical protein